MARGRAAALQALKAAAAVGDRVRSRPPGVVVLIYHRVGRRAETEIDMPADEFERQMEWLAVTGRVVDIDTACARLVLREPARGEAEPADTGDTAGADDRAGADEPTPHPVVVTFDDGTSDLAEVALPILARHRVPATVYLATRHVDEQLPWPADGIPLSWAGAQEMVDSGLVTIGSHTHSHALLDRLSPAAAAVELDRSRELIQERLGVTADHFAYPKAVAPAPDVERVVRDRFASAALGGNRPNPYSRTDLHRLARTAVQVSDGWSFFQRKADGGMALEDTFRRAANKVRYRGASG